MERFWAGDVMNDIGYSALLGVEKAAHLQNAWIRDFAHFFGKFQTRAPGTLSLFPEGRDFVDAIKSALPLTCHQMGAHAPYSHLRSTLLEVGYDLFVEFITRK